MAGTRVKIDFFFPDMTPQQVKTAFPELLPAIKAAKAKTSVLNAGKSNEEFTMRATYHICRHDEGKSCDAEVEI
jgi:hypothetical protein